LVRAKVDVRARLHCAAKCTPLWHLLSTGKSTGIGDDTTRTVLNAMKCCVNALRIQVHVLRTRVVLHR
jgi:hypothetical protein